MTRSSEPRRPQLPRFCRRQPRHTLVTITNLRYLHRLVWLLLLFQLTTVLLVLAGPVPPRPVPSQPNSTATHGPGPLMP
ncbi:hypothetical protein KQ307_06160 [Synechococcus sp. CS-1326]|uniref:hypothetical protein n=1 Tax=Synechococcus sp. CS-1326 TaxID=2847978 RepID=UPI00223B4248|nr:hypothetical protein [Synechococcus sp. CS-1326]MCT0213085.1 hypothetical protein [Synechococcus sp. CS-1326]